MKCFFQKLCVVLFFISSCAFGVEFVWSGLGGDDSWFNPGNWDGSTGIPGNGDDATFPDLVGILTVDIDNSLGTNQIKRADFEKTSGSYELTGGPLFFGTIGTEIITSVVDSIVTFTAPVVSGDLLGIDALGNLDFNQVDSPEWEIMGSSSTGKITLNDSVTGMSTLKMISAPTTLILNTPDIFTIGSPDVVFVIDSADGVVDIGVNDQTIGSLQIKTGNYVAAGVGPGVLSLTATITNTTEPKAALLVGDIELFGPVSLIGNGDAVVVYGNFTPGSVGVPATIYDIDLGATGYDRLFSIAIGSNDIDLSIDGVISNGPGSDSSGNCIMIGPGVLQFGGSMPNTFTGLTWIQSGTISLAKNGTGGTTAIAGDLTIEAQAIEARLVCEGDDQFAHTSTVTINEVNSNPSIFDLNGFDQTIGALLFDMGIYTAGNGSKLGLLTLEGVGGKFIEVNDVIVDGPIFLPNSASKIERVGSFGTSVFADISATSDLTFLIPANSGDIGIDVTGVISDATTVSLELGGTLRFSGDEGNTYTGDTKVMDGTLVLAKAGSAAVPSIPGALMITGGTVRCDGGDQIAHTSDVMIDETTSAVASTFDLNGFDQTIGSLTFYAGAYTSGAATLTVEGTASGSGGPSGGVEIMMRDVTIDGPVSMPFGGEVMFDAINGGTATFSDITIGAQVDFNVESGAASVDMDIAGAIGGPATVRHVGLGTLEFSGSTPNGYTGSTWTIGGGTISLNKSSGVIAIPGPLNLIFGTVLCKATDQMDSAATAITLTGGILDLTGFDQSAKSLFFTRGTHTASGGVLSLSDVTSPLSLNALENIITGPISLTGIGTPTVTTFASSFIATIGSITLASPTMFSISNGSVDLDLVVNDSSSMLGFTKTGAGTMQLSAVGSHDHGMSTCMISGGTLVVDGTLSCGLLDQIPGTILKGTGTIEGNVNIAGTFQPGGSIGTTTIIGDLTLDSSSITEIEISPTDSDFIDVLSAGTIGNGVLTIDSLATISIICEPGIYSSTEYLIASAEGGIVGFPSSLVIDESCPLFNYVLFIDQPGSGLSENLFLVLFAQRFAAALPPGSNAAKMGACFDQLAPTATGDLATIIGLVQTDTSIEMIANALNQIQPSLLKGLALSQQNNAFRVETAIGNRTRDVYRRVCKKSRSQRCKTKTWQVTTGDYYKQNPIRDDPGFHTRSGQIVAGADYQTYCDNLLGAAIGYSYSDIKWKKGAAKGTINSAYGALYATKSCRRAFVNLAAIGAYNHYYEDRSLVFGAIDRRARAGFNGGQFLGHMDLGYVLYGCKFEIIPVVAVEYVYMYQSGFREVGALSLNVDANSSNYHMARFKAGFEFTRCFGCNWAIDGRINYIREQRFVGSNYTGELIDTNCPVTVIGMSPKRNVISPAIGVTRFFCNQKSYVSFYYDAEIGNKFWDQNLSLKAVYTF